MTIKLDYFCTRAKEADECNWACNRFQNEDCPDGPEQVKIMMAGRPEEEIARVLNKNIEPVKLFKLRGLGKTDLEILTIELGY